MAIGRGETGAEESALGFVRKKVVAMAPLGRIQMGRPRLSEWSLMEIPELRASLSAEADPRARRALAAKLRRRESMAAPNSPRFRAWLAPYEAPLDPGDKYAGFSERELDGVLRRSVKASLVANESPARSGTPRPQSGTAPKRARLTSFPNSTNPHFNGSRRSRSRAMALWAGVAG
jgi:hypothetical protein